MKGRRVTAKTGLFVGIVIIVLALVIVVGTRPKAAPPKTAKLTDNVENTGDARDILNVTFSKKKDNLILYVEVAENIPRVGGPGDSPISLYHFLFDLDKNSIEDFDVTVEIGYSGPIVYGLDNVSFVIMDSSMMITIPSEEIGDLKSFNFRVTSELKGGYADVDYIIDNVPDVGWAEIALS